jgi:large subunit ribosomal protein L32
MAVPKKRTSKSKKNSRLAKWSHKATLQAQRALSLAKSVLSGQSTSFIYSSTIDKNDDLTQS